MDSETLGLVLIVFGALVLIMIVSRSQSDLRVSCPSKPSSCYEPDPCSRPEGFASELPYGSDKRSAQLAGSDYSQAIKNMALEDDVQASHSEWLGEFSHRTTTASKETVRDDPNDVVTPMGLAAVMLRNSSYNTFSQPQQGSRTIPSDVPSQMGGPAPSLTFYR